MVVSTLSEKYDWQTRVGWALKGRTHVLITGECAPQQRRSTIIHDLHGSYLSSSEYTPLIVATPQPRGTDTRLLHAIVAAAGLPPKRSRYELFRDFQRYCGEQYGADRRVLLLIEDAHLLTTPMMRVLHSLSTVVVDDDLAVQMVLVGRSGLTVKFRQDKWRALDSRVGLRVRIISEETKAA